MEMTPAEIARKAAEIIMTRGLAKGVLEDEKGRVCHNGAIHIAISGNVMCYALDSHPGELACRVISASQDLLKEKGASSFAPFFNDSPDTTAEDVILHLKELAEWLEENPLPPEVIPDANNAYQILNTDALAPGYYGFVSSQGDVAFTFRTFA